MVVWQRLGIDDIERCPQSAGLQLGHEGVGVHDPPPPCVNQHRAAWHGREELPSDHPVGVRRDRCGDDQDVVLGG